MSPRGGSNGYTHLWIDTASLHFRDMQEGSTQGASVERFPEVNAW